MKKTLKFLAAVALMALTAAACQKESLVDKTSEGNESVTFTVQTDAAATKATADNDGLGAGLDRCLVAVYMKTADPTEPYKLYDTPSTTKQDNEHYSFTVNLIRKQTYQIVVWADKGETVYDVNDGLTLVKRNTDDVACNSDAYDAFYATTEFVQGTTTSTGITAKRPFAQLNLITKDLREGFEPKQIELAYTADTKFNPFDGTTSDPQLVTYKSDDPHYGASLANPVPAENTVAMNYLFANDEQSILNEVKLKATFTDAVELTVANVPVRRNYRTNIKGNLFTEQTDFNITVEPAWGGSDIDVQVADGISSANAAFEAGKTVVEVASITASDPDEIILPDTDQPVSLTLPDAPADKTITIKYPENPANTPATLVVNAADLTNFVVDAPNTHVELNGITATNVTASTSATTLVVGADAKITNLSLVKGAVEIYGRVNNLTKAEGAGEVKCWTVYTSAQLKKAVKATKKVILGKNISANTTLDGVDTEIDLNGYYITNLMSSSTPLKIQNSKVKFTGTGSISSSSSFTMQIFGSGTDVADYTVVTIGKDVTVSNSKASSWGIFIDKDAAGTYNNYGIVLNIEGTISTSDNRGAGAITINGSNTNKTGNVPVINFNGANIKFGNIGVYGAGYAKWNFTNTNVEGKISAMEIRAGEVTINGGNYTATNTQFSATANGSGTTIIGAAIGVSQHGTDLPTSVTINDGTFNGVYALYEEDLQNDTARDQIRLAVNGGVFNGNIYSQNNAAFITGGTFSTDPSAYLPYEYDAVLDGNVYKLVKTFEEEGDTYTILSKKGLIWFEKQVNINGQSFSRKTVVLNADIDLAGIDFVSIGQTGATQFMGTFDGQNHTISNLKINNTDEGGNCATGLFGWLNSAIVKNIKISGANITGHHNVGTIAGYLETSGCTIENCTVENAIISCTSVNDDANGDKCGGIVGHAGNSGVKVKDCVVSNSSISAGRDAGQVVGAAKAANVVNCLAENVTVTANGTSSGANIREEVIGRVL